MGNNSSSPSNEESGRPSSSFQSSSSSSRQHGNPPQSSYSQYAQNYPVQHPYPAGYPPPDQYYGPPQTHGAPSHSHGAPPQTNGAPPQTHGAPSQLPPQKKFDRRYSRIADNYNSLAEVTEALRRAGLESSNLIIGIDFTKSNEWTGKLSNNGQSLHHIGSGWNPYEQAISIIGKTLADFDDDNLIPCFGFGDASTHDQDVFSFYPDRFCNKFEEVLSRYREIVPHLKLAGPTSFAPIIEMAMSIVEHNGGQYHVLVIIADGQVTRSVDTEPGQLSPQEQKTVQAIVEASKFPLSIILVGVGDGPWDTMKEFDDNIPARDFDNFQFVNFTEIMSKDAPQSRKETEFALASLMEIPSQYKASVELNLLGGRKGNAPERFALPPPVYSAASDSSLNSAHASSFQQTPSSYYNQNRAAEAAPSAPSDFQQTPSSYYNQNRAAEAAPSAFQQTQSSYYNQNRAAEAAPSAFQQTQSSYYNQNRAAEAAPSAPSAPSIMYENQICPICLTNPKDMAFSCGHQTCCDCGQDLKLCPVCRSPIQTRIKLY